MTEVVIIVLTFNQLETTRSCLNSLQSAGGSAQTLVWDNGSTDGTAAAIEREFPQVSAHAHPDNLGVALGRNEAARLATELFEPSYFLFLDNDMLVEPGFVEALQAPFLQDRMVGQTQAKLRFMHDRARLNDGGGARINYLLWRTTPVGYGELDRGQYDRVRECVSCGGAMMVRRDVFEELGGFDLTFNPFGPEDLDFSLRLQKAGYKALYVPQAVAYHTVSHTFGEGYSEEYARHKSRHWFYFMRRHATPLQQLGFFVCGAPYLAIQVVLREGRRGNLGAVRGLLRGLVDLARAPRQVNGGTQE
jgi:GT2 family glycosyltransferase